MKKLQTLGTLVLWLVLIPVVLAQEPPAANVASDATQQVQPAAAVILDAVKAQKIIKGDFGLSAQAGFGFKSVLTLSIDQATVTAIRPGGPADLAGLKNGQTIVAINGHAVHGMKLIGIRKNFPDYVAVGDTMTLLIAGEAADAPHEVTLVAAEKPAVEKE